MFINKTLLMVRSEPDTTIGGLAASHDVVCRVSMTCLKKVAVVVVVVGGVVDVDC